MSQQVVKYQKMANYERIDTTTCDLCLNTVKGERWKAPDAEHPGNRQDVEIQYEYGSSYPDGGSGTTETFDVCPDCWLTKVVPWFRSQGAGPRIREWDF